MWPILTTGFTLGLISSFHCVGMCGPLALALPVQHLTRPWRVVAILSYHAGRIGTYATLGLISGLLGRRIYLAGFQQGLSIALGTGVLLFVLAYTLNGKLQVKRTAAGKRPALVSKLSNRLLAWMTGLWTSPAKSKFLLLGMANGLLPCGMVYWAMAAALATAQVGEGVTLMIFFGAGTLPVLLGIHYFHRRIPLSLRSRLKKSIPFVMAIMGILLILRGLNLGIPFISPLLAHNPAQAVFCH
jgi:uncharacterized protein